MLTMPTTQRTGLPASRLGRARRSFRLYAALMGASLRSEAQYRANLLVQMLGAIAHQTAGFAFIWVVIERFGVIGGWTLAEIAFLYGMRLTAHGLFTFVASPVIEATVFDHAAGLLQETFVVREKHLKKLTKAAAGFFKSFETIALNDLSLVQVQEATNAHALSNSSILAEYRDAIRAR